jgi:serine/threonine protein kinase
METTTTQEAGQSPRQEDMAMEKEQTQISPVATKPSSPPAAELKQQQLEVQETEECDCQRYHSKGLGCPCNARYAIKVGRKATERILYKSTFFTKENALLQNEKERTESILDLDNSVHSAVNQILQLDSHSLNLGKMLGKGGFCGVFETKLPSRLLLQSAIAAEEKEEDVDSGHASSATNSSYNQDYCVKFLKGNVLPERRKFARGIADLAIEAHFLASLNHPHILKLRGVSKSFILFEPSSPAFLTDVSHEPGLKGGCFLLLDKLTMTLDQKINVVWMETQLKWNSLFNRTVHDIRGTKRKLFKVERIIVALQLAQAMQYLHQHNIVYRDLKPDNIGFDINGSLKLFDFGLAKELKDYKRQPDGTYQLTANTGSKRYMAPEVASRASYNSSVDVFSYGILLWEICSLEKPFDGFTEGQHTTLVVQRGHRPKMESVKHWPVAVRHIISRCWHPVGNERPTFRQVVNALIQVQNDMNANL